MAKKYEELSNPASCFNKAAPDEPIFILRAQDMTAPEAVRFWVHFARLLGMRPEKLAEAEELAKQMEAWPRRKVPD